MLETIHIINLTFLGMGSYFDCFRNKKVNDSLFLFWLIAILIHSAFTSFNPWSLVAPILIFILLSKTKAMGMGDILAFCLITLSIGYQAGYWLIYSIALSTLYAVINAFHKLADDIYRTKNKFIDFLQEPIPFFPFMTAGYIILILL